MDTYGTIKVNTKDVGLPMGDLFGIFFEDLNHAADGGLYGELVHNRSFEFDPIDNPNYHSLYAWEKVERGCQSSIINVQETSPLNERNTHYLVIDVIESGDGVGIMNLGYNTGIPIKKGETYQYSCYAKRDDEQEAVVSIKLAGIDGTVYGESTILVSCSKWKKYEVDLLVDTTDFSARLVITTKAIGKLYLDMISLFPEKVFKMRPNGLREDIALLLSDMKPKFMRFPGGCLVHDGSLDPDARDSMYRWKNTIGDVALRPARRSNWGYNQTLGLGYYEFFLFCEDIGAKPLPVLPAGYDPHHQRIVPLDELQPWIDDALDLIEFATGNIDTVWGAKRAELGHPEPFGLEYIAIGNEEVGEPFFERYPYFHKAIKDKYPDIKVINSSGPFSAGSEYDRGWKSARENQSDLVDEHYYQSPEWFLANYHRYDNFKAKDPKVFLGEYASWGNTYYNALVEAAFMTGLEKNVHAVELACYAPMLCNADYMNWKPDMIWYNNHMAYGTPNYYVQKLFMNHQGDHILSVKGEGFEEVVDREKKMLKVEEAIRGRVSIAGDQVTAKFYDIKLKNNETCEEIIYDNITTEPDSDLTILDLVKWENYTLTMKAKKIRGKKGFIIYFGEKDSKNRLFWSIGGWQNQDSIVCSDTSGRNSCLTQSLFTVEENREYSLEIKIQGRQIKTYIDNTLINETEDKLPIIEPLYYSASIEKLTGDVILKVINVQDKGVLAKIELDGMDKDLLEGKIFEMQGYSLDDENSFKSPERIIPKEKDLIGNIDLSASSDLTLNSGSFEYKFSKWSITIFRFLNKIK